MNRNEEQTGVSDVTVEVDHRVRAEGLRDGLDPGNQGELDAHQRQTHESEGDREVGPEALSWLISADERERQRGDADPDEDAEPGDAANDGGHRDSAGVALRLSPGTGG